MPLRRDDLGRLAGVLAPAALGLGACEARISPSIALFGAYFPYWLLCIAAGVLGALAMRGLFIQIGLDDVLPWRLLVYVSLAAIIGFLLALSLYGR